jgi:hypothetical protein
MNHLFTYFAVLLFAVISLLHLLRVFMRWEITIAGKRIPLSLSFAGAAVAAILVVGLLQEL